MDLSRFKEIEEKKVEHLKYAEQLKHAKLDTLDLKETMYSVTKTLISFLEGNTTKAVVLNQIRDFATSQDAAQLTQSIESLHDTLKTHENTDITPLTEVMNRVLEEVSKVPEGIKIPEQKFVDYSKQLDQLAKAVGLVEKAIESQETTVQAPEVNVAPAEVNVQAPDLKPLTKEIDKAFTKAIKGIKIPKVPKTDLTKLEKEAKNQTKLLKDIRDTPSHGGAGGSSSIAPFLNSEGSLPTYDPNKYNLLSYAEQLTSSASITPTSGKKLQIMWVQIIADPDVTTANLVTIGFNGDSAIYKTYALGREAVFTGNTDQVLDITLENAQPVTINIQYKEIT